MTPETTVYDYAMELAIARGWAFRTSEAVDVGLIFLDSRHQLVVVHPNAHTVTLRLNTSTGIFQNGSAKTP
jgi:hypothetical protein